jgi:large subunit ribosomal protein L21
MYAVIRTGGKQHRVVANDTIVVERLEGTPGDLISLDEVLMLGGADMAPRFGTEVPGEARVFAEVVAQQRGPKVIIFKKKRRKNHRRTRGHRQEQTVLRITAISADGTPPEAGAAVPVTAGAPEVEAAVVETAGVIEE